MDVPRREVVDSWIKVIIPLKMILLQSKNIKSSTEINQCKLIPNFDLEGNSNVTLFDFFIKKGCSGFRVESNARGVT